MRSLGAIGQLPKEAAAFLLAALLLCMATGPARAALPAGYHDATGTPLADVEVDWESILALARRHNALAAPGVEVHPSYVYVQDVEGSLNIPWQTESDLDQAFNFTLAKLYQALPNEFSFVIFFTSFPTGVPAWFYAPESNDTTGIGQQVWDDNGPDNPLEGFIFMNHWRLFEDQWGQFGAAVVRGMSSHTFNQEIGHRWLAGFTVGALGDGVLAKLLGRDQAHWSWFMHSEASPMEGNAWRDNLDGSFTTITTYENHFFSDLDLYLMGALSSEEVAPWFVIDQPDTGGLLDLNRRPVSASSPPQIIQPAEIRGTRVDYSIDDITSRLGQRHPAVGEAPSSFRVAFVILDTQAPLLDQEAKASFGALVEGYAAGFLEGTRGLASLDYVLMDAPPRALGEPCAKSEECDPNEAPLCAPPATQATRICTLPCGSASDCPADWCCAFDAAQSGSCHPGTSCGPEAEEDAGPGDSAPSAQDSGACLCENGSDCAAACPCELDPDCVDPQEGCGCRAAPRGSAGPANLILALLAWLVARRPRRS